MVTQLAIPPITPAITPDLITSDLPGYTLPSVPAQGTRVILLRHGRSTLNDAGCYQGSSDTAELTPKGRLASRQVGYFLRHCTIDHLYTSPLGRAQQTVEELVPQLRAIAPSAITVSSLLREIHLPGWEGLRYRDVQTRFPDAYRCWQEQPEQFALQQPSGTLLYPVQALYQQAHEFWTQTLPRHRGQTLLVVSHGSAIQALLNTALGLSMAQHHALQQTHSGLSVIDFAAPVLGQAQLQLLNLTTPISEPLPKLKAGKQGLRLLLLPCQEDVLPDASLATLIRGAATGTFPQSGAQSGAQPGAQSGAQSPAIAACLVEDLLCCQHSQRSWLAEHPETVVLCVGRDDFLHRWQRSLQLLQRQLEESSLGLPQSSRQPSELMTLAAVCHQSHAKSFLQQAFCDPTLTAPASDFPQQLLPNALTILHYPGAGRHPILQTLNSRWIPTPPAKGRADLP